MVTARLDRKGQELIPALMRNLRKDGSFTGISSVVPKPANVDRLMEACCRYGPELEVVCGVSTLLVLWGKDHQIVSLRTDSKHGELLLLFSVVFQASSPNTLGVGTICRLFGHLVSLWGFTM